MGYEYSIADTEYLNLESCKVKNEDLKQIAKLKNLGGLILGGNQISDFSALSGLKNLTNLDLSFNQISNISVLSGLTNLNDLNLWGNQISEADQAWLMEKLPNCF